MSKDTNKQAAEKLFAETAHNVLFANPKGEFFTSENIGALSLKPGQKLEKFERSAKKETSDDFDELVYEFNAKQTIAQIKDVVALENLKAFEADARKSVKEAHDKKFTELTAANEVKASTVPGTEDQK